MLKYIGKRLLILIPVLIAISLLVLVIIDLTPGDPARIMLGTQATEEQVQELRLRRAAQHYGRCRRYGTTGENRTLKRCDECGTFHCKIQFCMIYSDR